LDTLSDIQTTALAGYIINEPEIGCGDFAVILIFECLRFCVFFAGIF